MKTYVMLPPGKAVYDPTRRFTPGKAYSVIDEPFSVPHDLFSVIVDDKGIEALVCREPGFDGYLYDRAGWVDCDAEGRPLLEPYQAEAFIDFPAEVAGWELRMFVILCGLASTVLSLWLLWQISLWTMGALS